MTGRSTTEANADKLRFWLGLMCAAALHSTLIVGFGRSAVRYLGEPDGRPDAINVDLIEESQLRGSSTTPLRDEVSGSATRQRTQSSPTSPPAITEPQASTTPPDKDVPELLALPSSSAQQKRTAPKNTSKPAQKSDLALRLDLPDGLADLAGRGASATRPADITRSGENDEFGRRVIRALRQTMPSPRGILGRVTIRFLLSEQGNIAELQLVRSSGNGELDQSVMFASRQSNFPLPPIRSTVSDRSFLVTYIYD